MRDDVDDAIREDIAEAEARGAMDLGRLEGLMPKEVQEIKGGREVFIFPIPLAKVRSVHEFRLQLSEALTLPEGDMEPAICDLFDRLLAELTAADLKEAQLRGTLATVQKQLNRIRAAVVEMEDTLP